MIPTHLCKYLTETGNISQVNSGLFGANYLDSADYLQTLSLSALSGM